jgi:hypothetical protein
MDLVQLQMVPDRRRPTEDTDRRRLGGGGAAVPERRQCHQEAAQTERRGRTDQRSWMSHLVTSSPRWRRRVADDGGAPWVPSP